MLVNAADILNQDNHPYTLKVRYGGFTQTFTVRAKSAMYGVCVGRFCSFEIPGSKVEAMKLSRLTIRDGKFVKVEEMFKRPKGPS
jgi:hypothetical protein